MTPGARLQAVLELAITYEQALEQAQFLPADRLLQSYFRQRRYIGSHDRQEIAPTYYGLLRQRLTVGWWLNRQGIKLAYKPVEVAARWRLLAWLVLSGRSVREIRERCGQRPYDLAGLSTAEEKVLMALEGQSWQASEMPFHIRHNLPPFLEASFRQAFPDEDALQQELAQLQQEAPLQVRVNLLKATLQEAERSLQLAGLQVSRAPLSPTGLQIEGRPSLASLSLFQEGGIEVQDAASQLVSLLTQAQPGHAVLDLCAGAGGKSLALAVGMQNKGQLLATDIYKSRLEEAKKRFRRAGVHNAQVRVLTPGGDSWLKRQQGRFDRVLIDAPCSGTGTWRRNPDLRWRLTPEQLQDLQQTQAALLRQAAPLVKPGGWLVYATCSLLPEENHDQIDAFLAEHPEFTLVPVQTIWPQVSPQSCPFSGPYLFTTPHQHQVDGFFTAILARTPKAGASS